MYSVIVYFQVSIIPLLSAFIIMAILFFLEYQERQAFLKIAVATKGKVIAHIDAAHRRNGVSGYPETMNFNSIESMHSKAGVFFWVEFQALDGNIYHICTDKAYKDMSITELTLLYNPQQPTQQFIIDNFYRGSVYKKFVFITILTSLSVIAHLIAFIMSK